jgi:diguanylate cyclase (GGDEF)-like protein
MTIVGFLLALAPGHGVQASQYLAAAGLAAIAIGWLWLESARAQSAEVGPLVLYLVAIGLLRNATGGMTGGLGILLLLPVLWSGLHGTRRQLNIVLAAVALAFIVPQLAIGAPNYPDTAWRSTLLTLAFAAFSGHAVQQLVGHLRGTHALLTARERERDALLGRLQHLAVTDTLTDVPNRRAWEERVDAALSSANLVGEPLSVGLIDIDNFKSFNDHGGHRAGDAALRACAMAWAQALRPPDTLARVGGDEFAVLLPGCKREDAEEVATRLRAATPSEVTISMGMAQVRPGESREQLLHRADLALYAAKDAGRDQLVALAD